jgi:hypothetical protein
MDAIHVHKEDDFEMRVNIQSRSQSLLPASSGCPATSSWDTKDFPIVGRGAGSCCLQVRSWLSSRGLGSTSVNPGIANQVQTTSFVSGRRQAKHSIHGRCMCFHRTSLILVFMKRNTRITDAINGNRSR